MAEFQRAFEELIKNEGGYANDPDDRGGETYKGIARNFHPTWPGWVEIDILKKQKAFPSNLNSHADLHEQVRKFYELYFWHKVRCEDIESQAIAESVFDFAVNAGVAVSSKLTQLTCEASVDGVIGPKTLKKLNAMDPEQFLTSFALAKIARYSSLCESRPKNRKFFYGWVNRVLRGL